MTDQELRETVSRLIIENRNSLNDPTTNEPYDVNGIRDDVVSLIIQDRKKRETKIRLEAAAQVANLAQKHIVEMKDREVQARISELKKIMNHTADNTLELDDEYIINRFTELRAQKGEQLMTSNDVQIEERKDNIIGYVNTKGFMGGDAELRSMLNSLVASAVMEARIDENQRWIDDLKPGLKDSNNSVRGVVDIAIKEFTDRIQSLNEGEK